MDICISISMHTRQADPQRLHFTVWFIRQCVLEDGLTTLGAFLDLEDAFNEPPFSLHIGQLTSMGWNIM
jgi:hypothetical protein